MEPSGTSEKSGLGIVFKDDNRFWVENSDSWPYYWIGQFDIKFPNGESGTGTGTLIGRRHVLTCAHNLYQAKRGGYSKVGFSLGRNGQKVPYKRVAVTRPFVDERYKKLSPPSPGRNGTVPGEITHYMYDYGLVELESELNPSKDHFPNMYAAEDHELEGVFDIAGYPTDKKDPSNTMWNGSGMISEEAPEEFLFYKISTFDGNSGSAVRWKFEDKMPPRIVGIHVAGAQELDINFAVRLNSDLISQITDWMHKDA